MNLYHISQDEVNGYDTYSDAVVAAESAEQASRIHPSDYTEDWSEQSAEDWKNSYSWVTAPDRVKVELIGVASDTVKQGIICSSFHAG